MAVKNHGFCTIILDHRLEPQSLWKQTEQIRSNILFTRFDPVGRLAISETKSCYSMDTVFSVHQRHQTKFLELTETESSYENCIEENSCFLV